MKRPLTAIKRMLDLVRTGEIAAFVRRARELEPADLADVLSALDERDRLTVVQALPPELSSQALVEMPEPALAEETLAALAPERAAEIVEELDDDDAADILGELPRPTRNASSAPWSTGRTSAGCSGTTRRPPAAG
jgi:Mg/Co/Ni transporter MgtE